MVHHLHLRSLVLADTRIFKLQVHIIPDIGMCTRSVQLQLGPVVISLGQHEYLAHDILEGDEQRFISIYGLI